MLRAIKYELDPTPQQRELIKKTCGCCRLVYNIMLDRKVKAYKENKETLSAVQMINELPALKKSEEYAFLNEAPSQSLQQAIRNLDTAYTNFFKKNGSGFPKFKKKGVRDSYRIPVPCAFNFDNWTVRTAKVGTIKVFKGRNKRIDGTVKQYTISHTPTDRYYISVLYETADKPRLGNGKSVGIDLGIKSFATLSDGTVFENQKHLRKNERKLRVLQRSMARKYQAGKKRDEQSNNWKKARLRVARLQEKIAFQREDYLHKVSTWIARNYENVFVENLNVKGMEKNRHLAKSISDCSWSRFVTMLSYKCDNLVKVDRYFASSQTCSVCGYKNERVRCLNVREWDCPQCDSHHDRDLNASKNIEREGLSLCGLNVGVCSERAPRTQRFQPLE